MILNVIRRHFPPPWYLLLRKLRLETALTTTMLPKIPSAQMVPYMKTVTPSGKAERKVGRRTGEPRSMADPALLSVEEGAQVMCCSGRRHSYVVVFHLMHDRLLCPWGVSLFHGLVITTCVHAKAISLRSTRIVITDLYTYKLTDTQIYTPTNFSTASVLPTVYEVGL